MAITSKQYGQFLLNALKKKIDLLNDTIKVQLHTSTYSPDQDVHDFADDLTNEVANGNGYTTGGVTLGSKTLTYAGAGNVITFDAADSVWTGLNVTFRTAVIIDTSPGTAATNPLIAYENSDVDISPGGADYTIVWNASGIATITVA